MNGAILFFGLCVGTRPAPVVPPPSRLAASERRLLARYAADPSGFSPHFGKSDPASHVPRFGVFTPSGRSPEARDRDLSTVLHKPRMNTTLQYSVQWKGN